MIETLKVTNFRNDTLAINLREPQLAGLAITNITGIGDSKADVNMSDLVGIDGSEFVSSRRTYRNILITFRPVPLVRNNILVGSVEESRRLALKYFPAKKEVKLEFISTYRSCYCYGYVESIESDIFSKESTVAVSIVCPDPNFYDSCGEIETVFSGVESKFAFDIENTSELYPVSPASKVRAFSRVGYTDAVTGKIAKYSRMNIKYTGDVDIGFTVHMQADANGITGVSFYNLTSDEEMDIDNDEIERITGYPLKENDIITICTRVGQKSILLYRDAHYTNIINCINRDADWFQLSKGDNLLAYTATSGLENLRVRVDHLVAYEGV